MRKPNPKQRYALDGFVPRQPSRASQAGGRRATHKRLDSSASRRADKSVREGLADHYNSSQALRFDSEGNGSREKPLDIDLTTDDQIKQKKPKLWQFRKRRAYKKSTAS